MKLWRMSATFHIELICAVCAGSPDVDEQGFVNRKLFPDDEFGFYLFCSKHGLDWDVVKSSGQHRAFLV